MPIDAMRREFKEETRIPDILEWSLFATEYELAQQALVYFYAARCAQPLGVPRVNDSGERLEWTLTSSLHYNKDKIGNLSWLIPLALDPRRLLKVEVVARDDITEIKTW